MHFLPCLFGHSSLYGTLLSQILHKWTPWAELRRELKLRQSGKDSAGIQLDMSNFAGMSGCRCALTATTKRSYFHRNKGSPPWLSFSRAVCILYKLSNASLATTLCLSMKPLLLYWRWLFYKETILHSVIPISTNLLCLPKIYCSCSL